MTIGLFAVPHEIRLSYPAGTRLRVPLLRIRTATNTRVIFSCHKTDECYWRIFRPIASLLAVSRAALRRTFSEKADAAAAGCGNNDDDG